LYQRSTESIHLFDEVILNEGFIRSIDPRHTTLRIRFAWFALLQRTQCEIRTNQYTFIITGGDGAAHHRHIGSLSILNSHFLRG